MRNLIKKILKETDEFGWTEDVLTGFTNLEPFQMGNRYLINISSMSLENLIEILSYAKKSGWEVREDLAEDLYNEFSEGYIHLRPNGKTVSYGDDLPTFISIYGEDTFNEAIKIGFN